MYTVKKRKTQKLLSKNIFVLINLKNRTKKWNYIFTIIIFLATLAEGSVKG
jgi:hypothetical protein